MVILPTEELLNALKALGYTKSAQDNKLLANTPPGDPRRYCRLSVANEGVVTLSIFGADDVWIHQYIKTTTSKDGIEMMLAELQKLTTLDGSTNSYIRETQSGAELITFTQYDSKQRPIQLDKVGLSVYQGSIDKFPEYTTEGRIKALTIPSNTFHFLVSTTYEAGEHKEKGRPVRLYLNPFEFRSNAKSCPAFRFKISTSNISYEDEVEQVPNVLHLVGGHLGILKAITNRKQEEPVVLYYQPSEAEHQPNRLIFSGPLGEVSIPLAAKLDSDIHRKGFDYLDIYEKAQTHTARSVELSRLSKALEIQAPGRASHAISVVDEEDNNLRLYKDGDIHTRDTSNLAYLLTGNEDEPWPKTKIDHYGLLLLHSLVSKVKSFNGGDSSYVTLQLSNHESSVRRRRRSNQSTVDWVLNAKIVEVETEDQTEQSKDTNQDENKPLSFIQYDIALPVRCIAEENSQDNNNNNNIEEASAKVVPLASHAG